MHLRSALAGTWFAAFAVNPHPSDANFGSLANDLLYSFPRPQGRDVSKQRSLAMGYPGHEIFEPKWYLAWNYALKQYHNNVKKAETQLQKLFGWFIRPMDDNFLRSLEGRDLGKILQNTRGGLYKSFQYDRRRPDGLDSLTHVFKHAETYVYMYYPSPTPNVETRKGRGAFVQTGSLPPDIEKQLERYLAAKIPGYTESIKKTHKLNSELLSRFGIAFNLTLKYDYTCLQLTDVNTQIRQTRRLAPIFADARALVADIQQLYAARSINERQGRYRPQTFNKWVNLDADLPTLFLGYLGDDMLPFDGEKYIPRADQKSTEHLNVYNSFLFHAAAEFNKLTSRVYMVAQDMLRANLYRPKPRAVDQNSVASLQVTDQLDFGLTQKNNVVASPCSEQSLFEIVAASRGVSGISKLIIPDLCIQMPYQQVYPFERFFIQCRGWYPLLTLAFIVYNTGEGVQKGEPNALDVYSCSTQGWMLLTNRLGRQRIQNYMGQCRSTVANQGFAKAHGDRTFWQGLYDPQMADYDLDDQDEDQDVKDWYADLLSGEAEAAIYGSSIKNSGYLDH